MAKDGNRKSLWSTSCVGFGRDRSKNLVHGGLAAQRDPPLSNPSSHTSSSGFGVRDPVWSKHGPLPERALQDPCHGSAGSGSHEGPGGKAQVVGEQGASEVVASSQNATTQAKGTSKVPGRDSCSHKAHSLRGKSTIKAGLTAGGSCGPEPNEGSRVREASRPAYQRSTEVDGCPKEEQGPGSTSDATSPHGSAPSEGHARMRSERLKKLISSRLPVSDGIASQQVKLRDPGAEEAIPTKTSVINSTSAVKAPGEGARKSVASLIKRFRESPPLPRGLRSPPDKARTDGGEEQPSCGPKLLLPTEQLPMQAVEVDRTQQAESGLQRARDCVRVAVVQQENVPVVVGYPVVGIPVGEPGAVTAVPGHACVASGLVPGGHVTAGAPLLGTCPVTLHGMSQQVSELAEDPTTVLLERCRKLLGEDTSGRTTLLQLGSSTVGDNVRSWLPGLTGTSPEKGRAGKYLHSVDLANSDPQALSAPGGKPTRQVSGDDYHPGRGVGTARKGPLVRASEVPFSPGRLDDGRSSGGGWRDKLKDLLKAVNKGTGEEEWDILEAWRQGRQKGGSMRSEPGGRQHGGCLLNGSAHWNFDSLAVPSGHNDERQAGGVGAVDVGVVDNNAGFRTSGRADVDTAMSSSYSRLGSTPSGSTTSWKLQLQKQLMEVCTASWMGGEEEDKIQKNGRGLSAPRMGRVPLHAAFDGEFACNDAPPAAQVAGHRCTDMQMDVGARSDILGGPSRNAAELREQVRAVPSNGELDGRTGEGNRALGATNQVDASHYQVPNVTSGLDSSPGHGAFEPGGPGVGSVSIPSGACEGSKTTGAVSKVDQGADQNLCVTSGSGTVWDSTTGALPPWSSQKGHGAQVRTAACGSIPASQDLVAEVQGSSCEVGPQRLESGCRLDSVQSPPSSGSPGPSPHLPGSPDAMASITRDLDAIMPSRASPDSQGNSPSERRRGGLSMVVEVTEDVSRGGGGKHAVPLIRLLEESLEDIQEVKAMPALDNCETTMRGGGCAAAQLLGLASVGPGPGSSSNTLGNGEEEGQELSISSKSPPKVVASPPTDSANTSPSPVVTEERKTDEVLLTEAGSCWSLSLTPTFLEAPSVTDLPVKTGGMLASSDIAWCPRSVRHVSWVELSASCKHNSPPGQVDEAAASRQLPGRPPLPRHPPVAKSLMANMASPPMLGPGLTAHGKQQRLPSSSSEQAATGPGPDSDALPHLHLPPIKTSAVSVGLQDGSRCGLSGTAPCDQCSGTPTDSLAGSSPNSSFTASVTPLLDLAIEDLLFVESPHKSSIAGNVRHEAGCIGQELMGGDASGSLEGGTPPGSIPALPADGTCASPNEDRYPRAVNVAALDAEEHGMGPVISTDCCTSSPGDGLPAEGTVAIPPPLRLPEGFASKDVLVSRSRLAGTEVMDSMERGLGQLTAGGSSHEELLESRGVVEVGGEGACQADLIDCSSNDTAENGAVVVTSPTGGDPDTRACPACLQEELEQDTCPEGGGDPCGAGRMGIAVETHPTSGEVQCESSGGPSHLRLPCNTMSWDDLPVDRSIEDLLARLRSSCSSLGMSPPSAATPRSLCSTPLAGGPQRESPWDKQADEASRRTVRLEGSTWPRTVVDSCPTGAEEDCVSRVQTTQDCSGKGPGDISYQMPSDIIVGESRAMAATVASAARHVSDDEMLAAQRPFPLVNSTTTTRCNLHVNGKEKHEVSNETNGSGRMVMGFGGMTHEVPVKEGQVRGTRMRGTHSWHDVHQWENERVVPSTMTTEGPIGPQHLAAQWSAVTVMGEAPVRGKMGGVQEDDGFGRESKSWCVPGISGAAEAAFGSAGDAGRSSDGCRVVPLGFSLKEAPAGGAGHDRWHLLAGQGLEERRCALKSGQWTGGHHHLADDDITVEQDLIRLLVEGGMDDIITDEELCNMLHEQGFRHPGGLDLSVAQKIRLRIKDCIMRSRDPKIDWYES